MGAMGRPDWVSDVSVGDWIADRLRVLDGRVGSTVPAVFDAYARVLHPPHTMTGEPGSWVQVCARTGATAHPLMQWRAISRAEIVPMADGWVTERSAWAGSPPDLGNLPADALAALLDVLSGHTAGQRCVFALWEGLDWVDTRGASVTRTLPDGRWVTEEPPSAFPLEILEGPRLERPGRSYLLFTGPLDDAGGLGDPRGIWPQSPNLFWPADRSWCVATEIDFDSTLVGGSRDLVAAVLAHPRLEAWPVTEDDSLAWDADTINSGQRP